MFGKNVQEVRGDLASWLVGEVVQSLEAWVVGFPVDVA